MEEKTQGSKRSPVLTFLLQKPRREPFLAELPPEHQECPDAYHTQHRPRQLWRMKRAACVKQPAAARVAKRAAESEAKTAKAHIAAAGAGVRERSAQGFTRRFGDNRADIKEVN